jgi:hypothetical protein
LEFIITSVKIKKGEPAWFVRFPLLEFYSVGLIFEILILATELATPFASSRAIPRLPIILLAGMGFGPMMGVQGAAGNRTSDRADDSPLCRLCEV